MSLAERWIVGGACVGECLLEDFVLYEPSLWIVTEDPKVMRPINVKEGRHFKDWRIDLAIPLISAGEKFSSTRKRRIVEYPGSVGGLRIFWHLRGKTYSYEWAFRSLKCSIIGRATFFLWDFLTVLRRSFAPGSQLIHLQNTHCHLYSGIESPSSLSSKNLII